MSAMASQITSLTTVYSTVYSRRRSKKTQKFRVTGLCEGNSPVNGEFPAQRASDVENVSIWWRHHERVPRLAARHSLNQTDLLFVRPLVTDFNDVWISIHIFLLRECILKCRLCNIGHIFISKYDAIGAVCYGTSRPGFKVAAFAICNISPWWRHVTQKIALPALFENPSVTHKRPTMQKFVE